MNATTLQLDIEHFRASAKASICLDEITVLAGVNASGKSTLAHLFHSLVNLNAVYPTSLEKFFWDKLSRMIDAVEDLRWNIDHVGEARSAADRMTNRVFQPQLHKKPMSDLLSDFNAFQTESLDLCKSKLSNDDVRRAYSAFVRELRIDYKSASSATQQPDPAGIKSFIAEKIGETLAAYGKARLNRDYNAFLYGDYRSESLLLDTGAVSLREGDSLVYATNRISGSEPTRIQSPLKPLYGVERALYIESPWMSMPVVREGGVLDLHDGFPALKRAGKEADESLFSVLSGKLESVEKSMDALDRIFAAATSDFKWMYKRNDGRSFDLEACATGIRSLAILNAYYQWGALDSKTLLIIDEPEAHLHPQWIVEYARILVELNRRHQVRLLITSHNPDMVNAIKTIADEEKVVGLRFYLSKPTEDGSFDFTYQDLGRDIDPIFATFNKALDRIECYRGQL